MVVAVPFLSFIATICDSEAVCCLGVFSNFIHSISFFFERADTSIARVDEFD